MSASHSIQLFSSHQIDKQKWDACLQSADNAMIYAGFDYLQHMADNFAGIIVGDYEAIMPLIYRKKMGILYGYDAPFIQQLGLFGKYDTDVLKKISKVATKHIRYGDLFFNFQNEILSILPGVRVAENDVLSLHQPYEIIYSAYNNHLRSKLKQAIKNELIFTTTNDISAAIFLFEKLYAARLPQIKKENYKRLETLANHLSLTGQCIVCNVSGKEKNVLASALFFKDKKRIYNILPSTTTEGRKQNAMHFLLDHLIHQNAGSRLLLDFEGSDVPGIKMFYQSFGAGNQPYFHYHYNHLPFPLRLLKR